MLFDRYIGVPSFTLKWFLSNSLLQYFWILSFYYLTPVFNGFLAWSTSPQVREKFPVDFNFSVDVFYHAVWVYGPKVTLGVTDIELVVLHVYCVADSEESDWIFSHFLKIISYLFEATEFISHEVLLITFFNIVFRKTKQH